MRITARMTTIIITIISPIPLMMTLMTNAMVTSKRSKMTRIMTVLPGSRMTALSVTNIMVKATATYPQSRGRVHWVS